MSAQTIATGEVASPYELTTLPGSSGTIRPDRQRTVALALLGLGGALSVSWAGFLGWGAVQLASYVLG